MNMLTADGLNYNTKFHAILEKLTARGSPSHADPHFRAFSSAQLRHDALGRWREAVSKIITPQLWATWPIEHQESVWTAIQHKFQKFKDDQVVKKTPEEVKEWLGVPNDFTRPLLNVPYYVYRDLTIRGQIQSLSRIEFANGTSTFSQWRDRFLHWLQIWSAFESPAVRIAARQLICDKVTKIHDCASRTAFKDRFNILPQDFGRFGQEAIEKAKSLQEEGGPPDFGRHAPVTSPESLEILDILYPERLTFDDQEEKQHFIVKQVAIVATVRTSWPRWSDDTKQRNATELENMMSRFLSAWGRNNPTPTMRMQAIDKMARWEDLVVFAGLAHMHSTGDSAASSAHSLAHAQIYRRISHRTARLHGTTKKRWEAGRW